jgi:predicted helicase
LFGDNVVDENVFDISQAVAIHILARNPNGVGSTVHYRDLIGRRQHKYDSLLSTVPAPSEFTEIQPDEMNCGFMPQDEAASMGNLRLDSLFEQFGGGVKTNQDAVVIAFDDTSLRKSIKEFDSALLRDFRQSVQSILYRPFDTRRIFYHQEAVASRSFPTMKHTLLGPNVGFVTSSTWTTPDRFSVGISKTMVEMKAGTHDRGTTFFPLYRYESILGAAPERRPNLTPLCIELWSAATGTRFLPAGKGDLVESSGPEDILHWLYALFYSPEYRNRFRSALANRFPIVLIGASLSFVRTMVQIGERLAALHLMESPILVACPSTYFGPSLPTVESVSYADGTVALNRAGTAGFRGVSEAVWKFYFGGYQVCDKWLKDRKRRILSADEIVHYQKIIAAVSETVRIMTDIDTAIEQHGGWPDAFASSGE